MGASLLDRAAAGVPRGDRAPLLQAAEALRRPGDPLTRAAPALSHQVTELLDRFPLRELVTRGRQHGVWADRPLARCSAWYEMFPLSTGWRDLVKWGPLFEGDLQNPADLEAAFAQVKKALGVAAHNDWTKDYYQYANRIAHLWWLRGNGVDAHLLFVDFLNDADVGQSFGSTGG